ncbi:MAG: hypothetical protein WA213_08390 [Terriglobales bacterium]
MKATLLTAMLALVPSAWATTISYNFNDPTGKLGTSEIYTSSDIFITAYGFKSGKASDLFGNTDGLGLSSNSDQITTGFVQLDLSGFWAADATNVIITIDATKSGQTFEIFGSNTLGTLGTELQTGTANVATQLTLSADTYRYVSITAATGSHVVLDELSAVEASEPGDLAMLGIGVGLLGIAIIRKKGKGSAGAGSPARNGVRLAAPGGKNREGQQSGKFEIPSAAIFVEDRRAQVQESR